MELPDNPDVLSKKLFFVVLGGTVVFAAVVITFILSVN